MIHIWVDIVYFLYFIVCNGYWCMHVCFFVFFCFFLYIMLAVSVSYGWPALLTWFSGNPALLLFCWIAMIVVYLSQINIFFFYTFILYTYIISWQVVYCSSQLWSWSADECIVDLFSKLCERNSTSVCWVVTILSEISAADTEYFRCSRVLHAHTRHYSTLRNVHYRKRRRRRRTLTSTRVLP